MTTNQIAKRAVGSNPMTAAKLPPQGQMTWRELKQLRIKHKQLVRAIRSNLRLEVELLLSGGVVPHAFAQEDPLAIAIVRGSDGIVDALLGAGARSWRAMLAAATANKTDLLRRMIKMWDRPPLSLTLYWAVRAGALEAAELLLRNGAKDRRAALLVAVRKGHADLVELLLAHGARPNGEILRACVCAPNRDRHRANLRRLVASGGDLDAALRWFPLHHVTYAALANMEAELRLCVLISSFPREDANYGKAKRWVAHMSILANTWAPAGNWRDQREADRFDEALVRVHRELSRCAVLFGIEHWPNPRVTALML